MRELQSRPRPVAKPEPSKKKRVTTAPQKALGATLQRVLTLRQLKDVIADIYA